VQRSPPLPADPALHACPVSKRLTLPPVTVLLRLFTGTCETDLLSGTVSYAPDPVDDPADGSALICCSQPRGDLVLDL